MKKLITVSMIVAMLFCNLAVAKDHGFVTTLWKGIPSKSIFRVNIEKIDGKDANSAVNKQVKAGEHKIEVSLVFDTNWATGMSTTLDEIYYKTMSFEVEAGKTYTLASKVNTHATVEQQRDGSFWDPVIFKVH